MLSGQASCMPMPGVTSTITGETVMSISSRPVARQRQRGRMPQQVFPFRSKSFHMSHHHHHDHSLLQPMSFRRVFARKPCSIVFVVSQNARFVLCSIGPSIHRNISSDTKLFLPGKFATTHGAVPAHIPPTAHDMQLTDLRGIARAALLAQLGVQQ
jgi:hypothetical protein